MPYRPKSFMDAPSYQIRLGIVPNARRKKWFRKWSWSFIIFQDLLLFVILFEVPQYMYETLGCRYQISTPPQSDLTLSLYARLRPIYWSRCDIPLPCRSLPAPTSPLSTAKLYITLNSSSSLHPWVLARSITPSVLVPSNTRRSIASCSLLRFVSEYS